MPGEFPSPVLISRKLLLESVLKALLIPIWPLIFDRLMPQMVFWWMVGIGRVKRHDFESKTYQKFVSVRWKGVRVKRPASLNKKAHMQWHHQLDTTRCKDQTSRNGDCALLHAQCRVENTMQKQYPLPILFYNNSALFSGLIWHRYDIHTQVYVIPFLSFVFVFFAESHAPHEVITNRHY